MMNEMFEKAYNGSYYTIVGAGGPLEEWKTGYQSMLNNNDMGEIKEWVHFTGKDYNDYYKVTGSNMYPEDLNFLAFPLDGLDVGKLAIFKISMGDRWFDDIVDNDMRRERDREDD